MNRFEITAFHEILPYAANQIKLNLRNFKSKANLILLKIDVEYNKEVSNYHSCPTGGVPNWANRTKGPPRNYPGWCGRVWVFYSKDPNTSFSNEFINSLIHTGTGGYGLYNISSNIHEHIGHPADLPNNRYDKLSYKQVPIYPLSFGCSIFIDDFPGYKTQNLLLGQDPIQHYEGHVEYAKDYQRRIYSRSD